MKWRTNKIVQVADIWCRPNCNAAHRICSRNAEFAAFPLRLMTSVVDCRIEYCSVKDENDAVARGLWNGLKCILKAVLGQFALLKVFKIVEVMFKMELTPESFI